MERPSLVTLCNKYPSFSQLKPYLNEHYPELKVNSDTGHSRPDVVLAIVDMPEYRDTVYEILSYCSNYELMYCICSEVVVDWFITKYEESSDSSYFANACYAFSEFERNGHYPRPKDKYVLSYVGRVITLENEKELYDELCMGRVSDKMLGMYASKTLIKSVRDNYHHGNYIADYQVMYMFIYAIRVSKDRLLMVTECILEFFDKSIMDLYTILIKMESQSTKPHKECCPALLILKETYNLSDDDLSDDTKTKLRKLFREEV